MPRTKQPATETGPAVAPDPCFALADALLQRAALVARVARDRTPDPLAGLKVDDDDVLKLLGELPGLDGNAPIETAQIERATAPYVSQVTTGFEAHLSEDSRFARLVQNANLGSAAAEVLAVLYAVEVDPRRQRLVGYLNDDVTLKRLTTWTIIQLWGRDAGRLGAVSPSGALRTSSLLDAPGDGTWSSSPIVLAPAVVWWLAGVGGPDPELPPGAEVLEWYGADGATEDGADFEPGAGAGLVLASSPDRVRRLQAALRELGRPACVVTVIPSSAEQWDALVRTATLEGWGVVLEIEGEVPAETRSRVEAAGHVAWGLASAEELPLRSLPHRRWRNAVADAPLATIGEWESVFGAGTPHTHRLGAEQLHLVRSAFESTGDVASAVRRLAAGHISGTAQRIRPRRGWDDLVLDAIRTEQVREIAVRCRHRETVFESWGFAPEPSTGVVALFAGPSGTGKTLAAEVIAFEMGVDLYKVDLANLVSKYIGETEKNLSEVFDAAEAANVALFFDEADALFGKRSSVSDAHDRYANIEVAYLLQRLERYEGLAVMATNLVNNIDPAFIRRFHVVVEFPIPGPDERRRIWDRCLPPGAPIDADLDLDALSRGFELAGGTIRNAVLGAAFLAAEAGSPITMDLAVRALQREMEKSGRLVTASDFRDLDRLRGG